MPSCCSLGSMDHRGQILWSVTAICAMLRTSCQTGKLHRNGDMEKHSVNHFFLSNRRLNVIRYLQKVRRRFSCEGRSSQASSRAAPGMPEESGKETYSLQTLRNYKTFTRQKIHNERVNAKEVLLPKQGDTFAFHCADGSIKLADKNHEVWTSDQSRGHSEN